LQAKTKAAERKRSEDLLRSEAKVVELEIMMTVIRWWQR
jgi:hypothetical protein